MPRPGDAAVSVSIARRRALVLGAIAVAGSLFGLVGGTLTDADEQAVAVARPDPSSTDESSTTVGDGSSTTGAVAVVSTTAAPSTTGTPVPTTTNVATSAPLTTAPLTSVPGKGTGLRGAVIVVDPGHNGANGSHSKEISRQVDAGGSKKACNTTGTAEGSYSEAQFNWETSTRLADLLRARGATVILTRTDNAGWGPCIDQRGLTAANNRADLMISIHADGSSAGNHGFHVIRSGPIPGYVDAATADRSTLLATAARDALVTAGLSPSNYIGSAGLDRRNDLGTLNRAGVPAIMLESGNMHNAADLAMLKSATGQSSIATALVDAAAQFTAGR